MERRANLDRLSPEDRAARMGEAMQGIRSSAEERKAAKCLEEEQAEEIRQACLDKARQQIARKDPADAHEHPARRLQRDRATQRMVSADRERAVLENAPAQADRMLTEEEWSQLSKTIEVQHATARYAELIRSAVVLRLSRLHPDDPAKAHDAVDRAYSNVELDLPLASQGEEVLAEASDGMFMKEPHPRYLEYLNAVRALADKSTD